MRNNAKDNSDKQPSKLQRAARKMEAIAAIQFALHHFPELIPEMISELPQPKNPASACALLDIVSTVARFDIGRLIHAPEFGRWLHEGMQEQGAGSEIFRDRNGWTAHCLARHWAGDWGELDAEDKQANEDALKHGTRLLSAYTHEPTGEKVWLITEADRKSTTFLFPSEY